MLLRRCFCGCTSQQPEIDDAPGLMPPSAAAPSSLPGQIISTSPYSSNDVISRLTSSVQMHAPRHISYQEISIATNNFREVLGKGGFGTVFKGALLDDQRRPSFVAVKRLTDNAEVDLKSFEHEVTILAKVSHKNLVKLRGWCIDAQEYMVVYELLPNGSLDRFLFGDGGVLSWQQRFRILLGVASALSYLHDSASEYVILHRDLKPNNILLDGDYEAKLGDFGLSRELDDGRTGRTTLIAGTNGYMAPEMLSSGRATTKSDMYSYGAVLAAVACGMKTLERKASPMLLIDRIWQCHGRNCLLDMADQRLQPMNQSDQQEVRRVLLIALACCHPDPASRPSISAALEMLKGNTALPDVPLMKPRPYYALSSHDEQMQLPASTGSDTDANSSSASKNYCSATFDSQTLCGR